MHTCQGPPHRLTVHVELHGACLLLLPVRSDADQVIPAVPQHQVPQLQGTGGPVQGHPCGVGLIDNVAAGDGVGDEVAPSEAPAHGDEGPGGGLQRGAEQDRPASGAAERARG